VKLMGFDIRPARKEDEPFLWQMLYYAAHMDEEQGVTPESAKTDPSLAYYVEDWADSPGDLGFVASSAEGSLIGAAWIRVMPRTSLLYRHVPSGTPELAIAVEPASIGAGVGTALLGRLLEEACGVHRSIALSVRTKNPAKRLYCRMGFETVAQVTNRVGTESLVMVKRF
jgi:GNAT superfamily N-acetyltransferase